MDDINPILLIPIFVAGWIGISSIISFLGGWFWLAKRFPLPEHAGIVLQSYSWRSLNLNYLAGYSGCVNMKVTDSGLILKTSFLFSVFHRAMFLPWPSVSDLELKKGLLRRVVFRVGKSRLVFYGKAAIKIYETYVRYKAQVKNSKE